MFLTEDHSRVTPQVATDIKNAFWNYARSFDNVDDFIANGPSFAIKLKAMLERAGYSPNLTLHLFDMAQQAGHGDAYALDNEIVMTKDVISRIEAENPLYTTKRANRIAIRELYMIFIHELTHIKQLANGMPTPSKRTHKTLSFDFKYWFQHLDKEAKAPTYDYHSISPTELQVIGSQLAHEAMLKLQDWISEDWDEIIERMGQGSGNKFNNFVTNILQLEVSAKTTVTYRDALHLYRLDHTPFSHKNPVEHRALVLVYRSFVKTLSDWFYGHDDAQAGYDKAVEKRYGPGKINKTREKRPHQQTIDAQKRKDLKKLNRFLLVDKIPSRGRVRGAINDYVVGEVDAMTALEYMYKSIIGGIPFVLTAEPSSLSDDGTMHISIANMLPVLNAAKRSFQNDDSIDYVQVRNDLNQILTSEIKKYAIGSRHPWDFSKFGNSL